MDVVVAFKAVVMGVVEGLTEFLPVSSTGHLIVTGQLIGFMPDEKDKVFRDLFEVVIQFGAILAVAVLYRARLTAMVGGVFEGKAQSRHFALTLLLGLIPALIVGYATSHYVEEHFFNTPVVASALAVGGLVILLIERRTLTIRHRDAEALPWTSALAIGCFQCLAIVLPGASRSASTIMGSLLIGVERTAATNFSFMLAIPTMFAATVYKLWQQRHLLAEHQEHIGILAIGFIVSFIVAWASVAWLLRYISNHTFTAFGWYRICAGLVLALLLVLGLVAWKE